MLFSYGYGQQQIGDNNKCRRIAVDFECHTDAAVRRGVYLPIEHVQGSTGCHHQASACAVLLRRPSWLTNLLKQH